MVVILGILLQISLIKVGEEISDFIISLTLIEQKERSEAIIKNKRKKE